MLTSTSAPLTTNTNVTSRRTRRKRQDAANTQRLRLFLFSQSRWAKCCRWIQVSISPVSSSSSSSSVSSQLTKVFSQQRLAGGRGGVAFEAGCYSDGLFNSLRRLDFFCVEAQRGGRTCCAGCLTCCRLSRRAGAWPYAGAGERLVALRDGEAGSARLPPPQASTYLPPGQSPSCERMSEWPERREGEGPRASPCLFRHRVDLSVAARELGDARWTPGPKIPPSSLGGLERPTSFLLHYSHGVGVSRRQTGRGGAWAPRSMEETEALRTFGLLGSIRAFPK